MFGLEHLILDFLKTGRGRFVVSLLTIGSGLLFVSIAYPGFQDAKEMRRSRATTKASVVETRVSRGFHFETNRDVRYRFRLLPDRRWFTREEQGTGRVDLWCSLAEEEWNQVMKTGQIWVAYVPENPRNNCPVSQASGNYWDHIGFLSISTLLLCGGVIWMATILARKLRF